MTFRSERLRSIALTLAVLGGALATGRLATPGGLRIVFAIAASFFMVALATRSPRSVLTALVLWLTALGSTRRIASQIAAGISPASDPLLVVGAVAWVVLAVIAIQRGALRNRSSLTNAVALLILVIDLSALNPAQGSASVRVGGLFLTTVPMLAFVVGRTLVDDRYMGRLLILIGVLSIAAAMYGLLQTFHRFPSWDDQWIRNSGYAALNVGTKTRAFSSFSSAAEYAEFLGAGLVVFWVRRRAPFIVFATIFAVLATALWFESVRSLIVLTLAALVLITATRIGLTLPRAIGLGLVVLGVVPLLLSGAGFATDSTSGTEALAQHSISGLAHPFGESSTLPGHIDQVRRGLVDALHNPIGHGVGAITIAASKFSGVFLTTEADPGDAAVAAGLPGLGLYLAVVAIGFRRMHRQALRRQRPTDLAGLGILVITFFHWLAGGQYAVVFMPWLVLGWLDRIDSPPPRAPGAAERTDLEPLP